MDDRVGATAGDGAERAHAAEMTIAEAVRDADLRVLLMCVFQLSGDPRWLRAPYRPERDVRLVPPEDAGLPDDVADEIRDAAVRLHAMPPAIEDPGDELMVEMMGVCLGQDVPPEYAPMMREEMGFTSRDVAVPDDPAADPGELSILVVGAGASGIAIGARLSRMGLDYTIVEKGSSVGGVWRDNRYPGAGVDTPNHAYSFSFAPPNRWTRFFAPQPELQDYLRRTAEHCEVTPHVEFETELAGARWDDERAMWSVELRTPSGTERREVRVLISAIGQLNVPRPPTIAGMDDFSGRSFHSSHWPDDLDVTGRRVAVVGTGASSMQIVTTIAERVEQLTVFQRSAQWARPIPRYHDEIPAGSQWLFENLAPYAAWYRFTMLWRYGDGLLPYLRKDPDWAHPDRAVNKTNDRHRQEMADHIVEVIGDDPELIDKCMPDYPPYGKRILLDGGWFETMTRPDVELIVDDVERIAPSGVVDSTGRLTEVDVIVYATGFEVFQMLSRFGIVGRGGVDLADEWADDDPTAHLGITVPGFPNLFLMQGPTTGLGHGGSAIFQAECHARYITGCLATMLRDGVRSMEVREGPTREYTRRLDAAHDELIWTHEGMRNWYRNEAGRVVAIMPWRLVDYWAMTHDPDPGDFHVR